MIAESTQTPPTSLDSVTIRVGQEDKSSTRISLIRVSKMCISYYLSLESTKLCFYQLRLRDDRVTGWGCMHTSLVSKHTPPSLPHWVSSVCFSTPPSSQSPPDLQLEQQLSTQSYHWMCTWNVTYACDYMQLSCTCVHESMSRGHTILRLPWPQHTEDPLKIVGDLGSVPTTHRHAYTDITFLLLQL